MPTYEFLEQKLLLRAYELFIEPVQYDDIGSGRSLQGTGLLRVGFMTIKYREPGETMPKGNDFGVELGSAN
jgi:hypothetical protein